MSAVLLLDVGAINCEHTNATVSSVIKVEFAVCPREKALA
jgi:hypothetical protein